MVPNSGFVISDIETTGRATRFGELVAGCTRVEYLELDQQGKSFC